MVPNELETIPAQTATTAIYQKGSDQYVDWRAELPHKQPTLACFACDRFGVDGPGLNTIVSTTTPVVR